MCFFQADVGAILVRNGLPQNSYDAEIASLEEFIAADLVTVEDRVVRFDSPLKMLVRPVAAAFDRYIAAGENRYSRVA